MCIRDRKKAGKRAKQLDAMAKKAAQEDQFFRECQSAVQRSGEAAAARQVLKGSAASHREQALFAKQGSQGINFDQYDDIQVDIRAPQGEPPAPVRDFGELTGVLPEFLMRNLQLMNYAKPTPIQKHALAVALGGQDLMCCAQTGSGKTAAFLVPVCCSLSTGDSTVGGSGSAAPRCVAMAPTRELASQIEVEAQKLTNRSALRSVAVYGGADQRKQIRSLAIGCDIVVATPGRLTDFAERGVITLSRVQFLILDEADRMLDMGFEPQIRRIVEQCDMPSKDQRQTLLFSATFPAEIQKLAQQFLREYVWIAVGRVGSTTGSIEQRLVRATNDKRHKLQLLAGAIHNGPSGRTLVFVQKKRTATWVKKMLAKGGVDGDRDRFEPITACDIHGDRSQAQRESALAAFRSGSCRVLVATDVAARGLDIADVVHVINLDLPVGAEDFDSYVHRIGRTGRAGHTGLATSFYIPGNDKSANGKIAPLLLTLLREAKQEVPEWFAKLPECSRHNAGRNVSASGYGGHRPPQRPIAQQPHQAAAQGAMGEGAGNKNKRKEKQPSGMQPLPKKERSDGGGKQQSASKKRKDKTGSRPASVQPPGAGMQSKKRKDKPKPTAGVAQSLPVPKPRA
eukprot:TRINITY_DN15045_c0_g1_i1.p1 TRINITY_DN15045_c0_g1~~TRINITY_DN15045_c0_g1_i1.p1  ORF type:complete len:625 (+),score=151.83 TRINITY_DN15045_c0_g1_i1:158-2032(+)